MGSILSAIRRKEEEKEGGRARGNARRDTRLHFKPRPHRQDASRRKIKLKSGDKKSCRTLLRAEGRDDAQTGR